MANFTDTHKVQEDELQGLVFDCDGTLIDTMPAYWQSWKQLAINFKLKMTEKRFYEFAGVPVPDIIKILIDEMEEKPGEVKPTVEEVLAAKKELGRLSVEDIGTPKIDVVVDIARFYHGKIPMAVASSGIREHVYHSLKSNGIFDLFDAVVTSEDVTNPKPAPDIFLEAAKRINCDPRKCRGFEDGEIGLQSLRAAEMETIDVRLMDGYPRVIPSEEYVV